MLLTSLAILTIGAFAFSIFLIFLNCLETKAEQKKTAEAIAALAPGVYVRKSEIGNPFINEYDYIRVYEVKDGWVRYTSTRADRSADASAMRSIESECFIRLYARQPFD